MAKKQLEIVGTERVTNKEVDTAAEEYVAQRNKRMRQSVKEKEAKVALIETMKKHSLKVYKDESVSPPLVITLSNKDEVKVTETDSDEGDDGAGKALDA